MWIFSKTVFKGLIICDFFKGYLGVEFFNNISLKASFFRRILYSRVFNGLGMDFFSRIFFKSWTFSRIFSRIYIKSYFLRHGFFSRIFS